MRRVGYGTSIIPNALPRPHLQVVNRQQFSVGGWCRLCALLLVDYDLAEVDVK